MTTRTFILGCLLVAICEPAIKEGNPPKEANNAVDLATLTGVVKFEGKLPSATIINMHADPQCAKQHNVPIFSPLFASVTNSWLKIGTLCCLAHCGSACMLMIVALGNFPSNLTTPVSVAR